MTREQAVEDVYRIWYFEEHLDAVDAAVKNGSVQLFSGEKQNGQKKNEIYTQRRSSTRRVGLVSPRKAVRRMGPSRKALMRNPWAAGACRSLLGKRAMTGGHSALRQKREGRQEAAGIGNPARNGERPARSYAKYARLTLCCLNLVANNTSEWYNPQALWSHPRYLCIMVDAEVGGENVNIHHQERELTADKATLVWYCATQMSLACLMWGAVDRLYCCNIPPWVAWRLG